MDYIRKRIMKEEQTIDGILLAKMIRKGAESLKKHVKTVNNLNVFPIPDGDTGDNMLLTCMGGVESISPHMSSDVSSVAGKVSDGMLLSARGNSGVILSQIFEGMAKSLEKAETVDCDLFIKVLQGGTKNAYSAVMEPTEGTILTVMREATEYVQSKHYSSIPELLSDFLEEAKRTLEKTPDMLPVLKKAGVVDSGGAGLVYIVEGMIKAINGEDEGEDEEESLEFEGESSSSAQLDLSLFNEDSVLEFGYCTEVLVRLQRAKVDIETFDVNIIKDYLKTIGDSLVTFKNGSIVKVHVHTKTPDKVLSFCQRYGEFLKIKIENMSLQHNNTEAPHDDREEKKVEKKRYGVVAVCSGEGIKKLFLERGADTIVDGGQSMNPSTHDFLAAFESVNAETIFVLPNNGNIILAAKMAAEMYKSSDVRVIESKTIGDGYAALSMFNDEGTPDEVERNLSSAMEGVTTAEISKSIRDADGVRRGEYIGFCGKDILVADPERGKTVLGTLEKLDFSSFDIALLIFGRHVREEEAETTKSEIEEKYPLKEVYILDGNQEIYDYIIILE